MSSSSAILYRCNQCGGDIKEHRAWRIAKRRDAGAGVLRCASCAAKKRHRDRPIYSKTKATLPPTALAGLDAIGVHLGVTAGAAHRHIRLGHFPTMRVGNLHVAISDQIPPYDELRERERRERSKALKRYVASPRGRAHHDRLRKRYGEFSDGVTDTLLKRGLVPTRQAAELLYRAATGVRESLEPVPVEFGGLVRFGFNAREVLAASPHPDARRKIAKALAVLNGTDRVGRRPALSEEESQLVIQLRLADPDRWGWRSLADEVNRNRPPERWISYAAVRRAFLRATSS